MTEVDISVCVPPSLIAGGEEAWLDYMRKIGYVRYYPIIGYTTAMIQYLDVNQNDAYKPYEDNNFTYNFDYVFKVPVTVAAENAILCFTNFEIIAIASTITLTIYHVDAAAATTSLGTVAMPFPAGALGNYRNNVPIALTKKTFKAGESLRLTIAYTGDAHANKKIYLDPTTQITVADGYGRTVGSDFTMDIPFKVVV